MNKQLKLKGKFFITKTLKLFAVFLMLKLATFNKCFRVIRKIYFLATRLE